MEAQGTMGEGQALGEERQNRKGSEEANARSRADQGSKEDPWEKPGADP